MRKGIMEVAAVTPRRSAIRDIALHDLRRSHQAIRDVASLASDNPVVRHILSIMCAAESATDLLAESLPPIRSGKPKPLPPAEEEEPEFVRAHAERLHRCGGSALGCEREVRGNAIGAHQRRCKFYKKAVKDGLIEETTKVRK